MSNSEEHTEVVASVAACSQDVRLENEMRLIRSALLYADKVRVCSPNITMAVAAVDQTDSWSGIRQIIRDLPDCYLPAFDQTGEELKELFGQIGSLNRSAPARFRAQLISIKRQTKKKLQTALDELNLNKSAAHELKSLQRRGLLEIDNHPNWTIGNCIASATLDQMPGLDEGIEYFFSELLESIKTPGTLPVFDENSSGAVRAALAAEREQTTKVQRQEAREARLIVRLFDRLPGFDQVAADELIDIRRELEDPLLRFRGAVLDYISEIEAEAWDEEFDEESQLLYRQRVAPAVSELEERMRENAYLRKLLPELGSKTSITSAAVAAASTLVGLGVTNDAAPVLADLAPEALGMAGLSAGVVSSIKAFKDWRNQKQKNRKHELFFYCKTTERIGG